MSKKGQRLYRYVKRGHGDAGERYNEKQMLGFYCTAHRFNGNYTLRYTLILGTIAPLPQLSHFQFSLLNG